MTLRGDSDLRIVLFGDFGSYRLQARRDLVDGPAVVP